MLLHHRGNWNSPTRSRSCAVQKAGVGWEARSLLYSASPSWFLSFCERKCTLDCWASTQMYLSCSAAVNAYAAPCFSALHRTSTLSQRLHSFAGIRCSYHRLRLFSPIDFSCRTECGVPGSALFRRPIIVYIRFLPIGSLQGRGSHFRSS